MKINKFLNKLLIISLVILVILFTFLSLKYKGPDLRHLSSKDYSEEIVHRIDMYSLIYNYLIILMIVLVGIAFYKIFSLLTSNLISARVFNVIGVLILYFISIACFFRGYNTILVADSLLNLTGEIAVSAFDTLKFYFASNLILILGYVLERQIAKSIFREYSKNYNNKSVKHVSFDKLKEIINNDDK